MNKIVIFIAVVFCNNFSSDAQINLVRNPSFEKYVRCPNVYNDIKYAPYWSSTSDTFALSSGDSTGNIWCTPEYCNACASGSGMSFGVPYGACYHHYPRTGGAMASVQMFYNASVDSSLINIDYSDYLQGRLFTNLTNGKNYCVSFYVSLAYASAWAINHIGAYFDDGTIDTTNWCGWPQTAHIPQVYTDSIINNFETDSVNWVKIEGSFTATGTESFITIGNFFDSAHTDKVLTGFSYAIGAGSEWAWYLVDDVSVIASDDTAYAGIDRAIPIGTSDSVWVGDTTGYLPCYWYRHVAGTTGWVLIDSNTAGFKVHPDTTTSYVMQLSVCGHTTTDTMTVWVGPVSVRGSRAGAEVALYPNPAGNEVTVEGVRGCEVRVIDMVGRCLVSYHCSEDVVHLPLAGLEQGMYFVEVVDVETGVMVVRKMVKSEHD